MLTLRDYQHDMIARARAELQRGVKRVLLQGPTGMGKTALTAHMLAGASARGKRAWFLVHRRELVDQSVRTFVEAADLHVGIVAAGYPSDASAPVQVCSVGTLRKRLAKLKPPDLVVWDECHHLPSQSWASIATALPNAVHIGLTATPARLDGRGLRPFFDALVCGPSTADLIAAGYLSPYRLFAPGVVNTDGMHRVGGDFNRHEVATAMGASTVVGDAVATYQRDAQGGRALVFVWSLEASRRLAATFTAAGIAAAHVDGDTDPHERRHAMAAFREGSLRVICNVDLFGEGLDVPAVDAVFLLRPTDSLSLFLQQCGRGLRPSPGKDAVRIFDHVGNWTRHGLPDDTRTWSLDGKPKGEKPPPSPRRCAQCFAVSPAMALVCVACGAEFPRKPRKIHQVEGQLVEADLTALRGRVRELEAECRTLQDWQDLAKRMHYAPGWAWYRWTARRRGAAFGRKTDFAQDATEAGKEG